MISEFKDSRYNTLIPVSAAPPVSMRQGDVFATGLELPMDNAWMYVGPFFNIGCGILFGLLSIVALHYRAASQYHPGTLRSAPSAAMTQEGALLTTGSCARRTYTMHRNRMDAQHSVCPTS